MLTLFGNTISGFKITDTDVNHNLKEKETKTEKPDCLTFY